MKESLSIAASVCCTLPSAQRPTFLERMFARRLEGLRVGKIEIEFPSGAKFVVEGELPGPHAVLKLHDLRLLWRVMASGDLGFAEGYIEDECDTPDLSALLRLGALNQAALESDFRPTFASRCVQRLRHALRANSKAGSRRNIAAHYDLGNNFFAPWLDPTMTYSAAIFTHPDEPYEAAQLRKYRRLASALDLRPGQRVLEIGCGWGGFAEVAAGEFGCRLVCLTLSEEQARYARDRMARAGLADQVEIRLQDYRDVDGSFDAIVSIEMFEAVGEKNWPVYFDVLRERLKPGARAALQVITIDDLAFEGYRTQPDFVQRHIFPGGMLPSPSRLGAEASRAGLSLNDSFFFGASYAESLRRWDAAFTEAWLEIAPLGFDRRFYRMWKYYLAYCEAGFTSGRVNVGHFVFDRS
jgi:cyclopropane-fatty-acyl-phospholipid synthase